jgi:BarA-like signal transduction histidine kinase
MTDQTPSQPNLSLEQTVVEHSRAIAQIDAILLAIARQQQVNAQQIAANAEGIAELRAILRDRFSNGHAP